MLLCHCTRATNERRRTTGQVGCQHGPGGAADPGLSDEETRSHFGAWAIVSSPLVLSHDVNNDTVSARVWDVIANTEIIAINQVGRCVVGGCVGCR